MAKRIVQECDLTKQEYDPEETVTLVIKRTGKKQGRTYELSAAAATKLEQQLISNNKLPDNWSFIGKDKETPPEKRTLADLDVDAEFVAAKKKEMKSEGVETKPHEEQTATIAELAVDDSGCMHLNKGPIQATMIQGKRKIYRACRDCRTRIPEKTVEEKSTFFGAKAPADTREGFNSIAKERNKS